MSILVAVVDDEPDIQELVARVRSVLRRNEPRPASKVLRFGSGLSLDLDKHEVEVRGVGYKFEE